MGEKGMAGDSWKALLRTRGEERKGPAAMLKRPDGTYTANPKEMDQLLREAWDPIFRMYADKPEPAWEPFWAQFGQYVKHVPMDVEDFTAASLTKVLARCNEVAGRLDQ